MFSGYLIYDDMCVHVIKRNIDNIVKGEMSSHSYGSQTHITYKRCSFECDMDKYNTCSMNKVGYEPLGEHLIH